MKSLPQPRVPVPGRTYHYRYGYPWRWAVLAEIAWQIEHTPLRLLLPAYRWRKSMERKGYFAATGYDL